MDSYQVFSGVGAGAICFSDSSQPKTIRSLHRPPSGPTNISFSLVRAHEDRDRDRDRGKDRDGILSSHQH